MSELSEHITSAPVVILTGAGASVPLGKPTTAQFVESIDGDQRREHGRVWSELVRSCSDMWHTDLVDVEMILQHVGDMLDLADRVRRDYNLVAIADNAKSICDRYRTIESQLCEAVVERYSDVPPARATALYKPLFKGLRAHPRTRTLPIFTLNYDLAVETAATRLSVPLVDGVRRGAPARSRWSAAEFHRYAPRDELTVVLFKLHGSTTWAWGKDGSLVELPSGTGKDPGAFRHALLYPYLSPKGLEREPFKTGYAYLAGCLGKAEVLLIVGTSLRDQHLVEVLRSVVAANSGLQLLVVDPRVDAPALAAVLQAAPERITGVNEGFSSKVARALVRVIIGQVSRQDRDRGVA